MLIKVTSNGTKSAILIRAADIKNVIESRWDTRIETYQGTIYHVDESAEEIRGMLCGS